MCHQLALLLALISVMPLCLFCFGFWFLVSGFWFLVWDWDWAVGSCDAV
jgi:hypothetical protein